MSDTSMAGGEAETPADIEKQYKGKAKLWHMELALAEKEEGDWMKAGAKVVEKYRDKRVGTVANKSRHNFNILWSNTELLKPALYSETPEPIVRRRFGRSRMTQSAMAQPAMQPGPQQGMDPNMMAMMGGAPGGQAPQGMPPQMPPQGPMPQAPDPAKQKEMIARSVAEVLERGLAYTVENYDFDGVLKDARDDYLLPGRGVARVVQESRFAEIDLRQMIDSEGQSYYVDKDGMQRKSDGQNNGTHFFKELAGQESRCEYVYWQDYRQSPARSWRKVRWTAYAQDMDRTELIENFGEAGRKVKLTLTPKNMDGTNKNSEAFKKVRTWEIWDKMKLRRVFVAEGHDDLLGEDKDPYGLKGFFPSPEPIMAVKTNDTMVPIPEYSLYQDQADELDTVTYRINKLIKGMKAVGFYPGAEKEKVKRIEKMGDNSIIPIENWMQFVGKGGGKGLIEWVPIDMIIQVLQGLYIQRNQLKEVIYEVTGISDLLRGSSDPKETATAARIKGQFGTLRLSDRQSEMQRFARDLLRMVAELMAEHMAPQSLEAMTGIEVTPEMTEMMRDDKLRCYAINIETDSTLKIDEEASKSQLLEMNEVIAQGLVRLVEAKMQAPELIPVVGELLMTTVRGFRRARGLEDEIEQAVEEMKQALLQGGGAQGQDEAGAADAAKAQAEMQKAQMTQQIKMQELQLKGQIAQAAHQMKAQEGQQKAATEQYKIQLETQKLELEKLKLSLEIETERRGQDIDSATDIEVAEIQAESRSQPRPTVSGEGNA
jgi:hypothetical protein